MSTQPEETLVPQDLSPPHPPNPDNILPEQKYPTTDSALDISPKTADLTPDKFLDFVSNTLREQKKQLDLKKNRTDTPSITESEFDTLLSLFKKLDEDLTQLLKDLSEENFQRFLQLCYTHDLFDLTKILFNQEKNTISFSNLQTETILTYAINRLHFYLLNSYGFKDIEDKMDSRKENAYKYKRTIITKLITFLHEHSLHIQSVPSTLDSKLHSSPTAKEFKQKIDFYQNLSKKSSTAINTAQQTQHLKSAYNDLLGYLHHVGLLKDFKKNPTKSDLSEITEAVESSLFQAGKELSETEKEYIWKAFMDITEKYKLLYDTNLTSYQTEIFQSRNYLISHLHLKNKITQVRELETLKFQQFIKALQEQGIFTEEHLNIVNEENPNSLLSNFNKLLIHIRSLKPTLDSTSKDINHTDKKKFNESPGEITKKNRQASMYDSIEKILLYYLDIITPERELINKEFSKIKKKFSTKNSPSPSDQKKIYTGEIKLIKDLILTQLLPFCSREKLYEDDELLNEDKVVTLQDDNLIDSIDSLVQFRKILLSISNRINNQDDHLYTVIKHTLEVIDKINTVEYRSLMAPLIDPMPIPSLSNTLPDEKESDKKERLTPESCETNSTSSFSVSSSASSAPTFSYSSSSSSASFSSSSTSGTPDINNQLDIPSTAENTLLEQLEKLEASDSKEKKFPKDSKEKEFPDLSKLQEIDSAKNIFLDQVVQKNGQYALLKGQSYWDIYFIRFVKACLEANINILPEIWHKLKETPHYTRVKNILNKLAFTNKTPSTKSEYKSIITDFALNCLNDLLKAMQLEAVSPPMEITAIYQKLNSIDTTSVSTSESSEPYKKDLRETITLLYQLHKSIDDFLEKSIKSLYEIHKKPEEGRNELKVQTFNSPQSWPSPTSPLYRPSPLSLPGSSPRIFNNESQRAASQIAQSTTNSLESESKLTKLTSDNISSNISLFGMIIQKADLLRGDFNELNQITSNEVEQLLSGINSKLETLSNCCTKAGISQIQETSTIKMRDIFSNFLSISRSCGIALPEIKAKNNLYTEEQVRTCFSAFDQALKQYSISQEFDADNAKKMVILKNTYLLRQKIHIPYFDLEDTKKVALGYYNDIARKQNDMKSFSSYDLLKGNLERIMTLASTSTDKSLKRSLNDLNTLVTLISSLTLAIEDIEKYAEKLAEALFCSHSELPSDASPFTPAGMGSLTIRPTSTPESDAGIITLDVKISNLYSKFQQHFSNPKKPSPLNNTSIKDATLVSLVQKAIDLDDAETTGRFFSEFSNYFINLDKEKDLKSPTKKTSIFPFFSTSSDITSNKFEWFKNKILEYANKKIPSNEASSSIIEKLSPKKNQSTLSPIALLRKPTIDDLNNQSNYATHLEKKLKSLPNTPSSQPASNDLLLVYEKIDNDINQCNTILITYPWDFRMSVLKYSVEVENSKVALAIFDYLDLNQQLNELEYKRTPKPQLSELRQLFQKSLQPTRWKDDILQFAKSCKNNPVANEIVDKIEPPSTTIDEQPRNRQSSLRG